MKRSAAGTFPSYKQATKRVARKPTKTRAGFSSTARTRGAAVQGEMKYMDSDYNAVAIPAVTTTWVAGTMADPLATINLGTAAVANPQNLCAPQVGATLNSRVGRKINVHKIKVHGKITAAFQTLQPAPDSGCKIRVVLVQDMQTNAGQMTGAQLYNDGTGPNTVINTFQNPNNFGRFRVLKDKMYQISDLNITTDAAGAAIAQAAKVINFKFMVNFKKPVVVHFNATNAGTVGDIVDNSFHILAATDNVSFAPTLSYYCRVAYKDV